MSPTLHQQTWHPVYYLERPQLQFVGASRELAELTKFFSDQKTTGEISELCSTTNIEWKFIPEHAPHFGGLWESAVRSMKSHLKKVVGDSKLTFEELATVLRSMHEFETTRS